MKNSKSPQDDDTNSRYYNDDAFGFVFLTGGQDVDFVISFGSLSAIAAICTYFGVITKDTRTLALVAILTVIVSPIVTAVHQHKNLEPPTPFEIGVCLISFAFVKQQVSGNKSSS